ncbi:unnamed protein product [Urochloa decumbens]|uniref:F-box domain-containing protein n=1 Tax=Urochloa decumbens TaxID=240449 RepID=A0ABC9GBE3_9POAL
MAPPPRSPPALMDELVEEIALRFPPDEPERLFRAALACKRWRRILSDPGFRRRYREFHRSPPMLGFLCRRAGAAVFTPTTSLRLPSADLSIPNLIPMDARHGRVLFYALSSPGSRSITVLVVWNPFTGEERRLDTPTIPISWASSSAAFLCTAAGCSHLDCPRGGPFSVVLVATDASFGSTSARVFSSETGAWRSAASIGHSLNCVLPGRSYLIWNTLYFISLPSLWILEYDLGRQELSLIDPPSVSITGWAAVIKVENGGLGFAIVQESKLSIWAWENDGNVWAQHRVIQLQGCSLPVCSLSSPYRIAALAEDGACLICWNSGSGVFAIDLKLGWSTKIATLSDVSFVIPYMCFYTPALGAPSTSEGSGAGVSNA